MLSAKKKLAAIKAPELLKLDFGCGKNKREDFHGVDSIKFDGVDTVMDLRKKWHWADGVVDEAHASHFLEHLTGPERVHFFNELFRVLRPGASANIIVPSWTHERAYGDPTHQWPPVTGFSFYYLNKKWRDVNAPHCGYTCDFDFSGGNGLAAPWDSRPQEVQAFAQTHYINVATDMYVTVTKRNG
jgi:hypothetical protein